VPPPQSTSVSSPFFSESLQLGATHLLLVQMFDAQSVMLTQLSPVLQRGHKPPPQSTSVSAPFLAPSKQFEEAQMDPLVRHKLEMQSLPWRQDNLAVHLGQFPPQSTSVSFPFLTLSEQVGAWHTKVEQTPDTQSPAVPQRLKFAQATQLPPQSVSVSFPFFLLSEHVGCSQYLQVDWSPLQGVVIVLLFTQTTDPQSPSPRQPEPNLH